MKIKYDLNDNLLKYLNMANGVSFFKNSIKKNPNKKVSSYTTNGLYFLLFMFLFFIGGTAIYVFSENKLFLEVFSNIFGIFAGILTFYFIIFLGSYFYSKKMNNSGTIIIEKDGISDVSNDGVTIKFDWDKIDFIFIQDNQFVVIVREFPLMIIAVIDDVDKAVETIKKYNEEGLLIVR